MVKVFTKPDGVRCGRNTMIKHHALVALGLGLSSVFPTFGILTLFIHFYIEWGCLAECLFFLFMISIIWISYVSAIHIMYSRHVM